MTDYAQARHNMVEGQIRTNRVTDDRLIDALREVPRELFVPKSRRSVAYVDEDVALGGGRFLVEPMVMARLFDSARVTEADIVLDLGCASGYSTAILARVASTVVGIEGDPDFVAQAGDRLDRLSIDNAVVLHGEPTAGYPDQAPYDVIHINGSVARIPDAIFDQLAEGGRLVTVDSPDGRMGRAVLYRKLAGRASRRVLFDAATPTLPGFESEPAFVF